MVVLHLKVKSFQYRTGNKGKQDLVLRSHQLIAVSFQKRQGAEGIEQRAEGIERIVELWHRVKGKSL